MVVYGVFVLTYSIVGLDPVSGFIGVGTASGSIAVGSRVPWAKYLVGGVATQAYTNPSLGPLILGYLEKGLGAAEALRRALESDPEPEYRQVAVIDYNYGKAVHNGSRIPASSGWSTGDYSVCNANLVVSTEIPIAMCRVFEEKLAGKGLAWALIEALKIAENMGGDKRGDHSAAILVAGKTPYGKLYDKIIDLRIDYAEERPVEKLAKLLEIYVSKQ